MINHLEGIVAAAGATWVVLDINGFGMKMLCTPATAASVRLGEKQRLETSLIVREDSLTLFAFSSGSERDAFEVVQTASGVGPKLALAVVSVLAPDELRTAIQTENVAALTRVPGIGPKGAKKMVIELKDKVVSLGNPELPTPDLSYATEPWREQVRLGLESLGWSTKDADAAVEKVVPFAAADPTPNVAELMKQALRTLAK
ncbi:MAG: Holliday junction branch migration protein RuvA [Propionibacteriaceae bacterium]